MHFKNQWYTNWQCRRFGCCDANVQFGWIQQKLQKSNRHLANYYRDEPSNLLFSNSESFKYKISITGNTYNIGDGEVNYDPNKVSKNETEVVVPLKNLSNFWRTLNIPLINCEIELVLTWSKNCTLADMTVRAAGNGSDLPVIVAPTRLVF